MLFDIAVSEGRTPFPIMLEALVIHFIYEIMREAGLRMPKTVGHAVSIVGALVIGDAAVTAGAHRRAHVDCARADGDQLIRRAVAL